MRDEEWEAKRLEWEKKTTAPRWLAHGASVWAPYVRAGVRWWVPSVAVEVAGTAAWVDTKPKFAAQFPREGQLMALEDLRVLVSSGFAR